MKLPWYYVRPVRMRRKRRMGRIDELFSTTTKEQARSMCCEPFDAECRDDRSENGLFLSSMNSTGDGLAVFRNKKMLLQPVRADVLPSDSTT